MITINRKYLDVSTWTWTSTAEWSGLDPEYGPESARTPYSGSLGFAETGEMHAQLRVIRHAPDYRVGHTVTIAVYDHSDRLCESAETKIGVRHGADLQTALDEIADLTIGSMHAAFEANAYASAAEVVALVSAAKRGLDPDRFYANGRRSVASEVAA